MVWTCPKCNKTWLEPSCPDCLINLPRAPELAIGDDGAVPFINNTANDIQKEHNNIPNRKNLLSWADKVG